MGGTTFLTPGLINAHTHLELYTETSLPILPGESMADWILKVIAVSREMTDNDKLRACHKSILEMIRTGTTCVNDITSTGVSLEALSQVGMRGIVSPEFFYPYHHEEPDLTHVIERFQTLNSRFQNHPLLHLGISPHAPYNVTPHAYQRIIDVLQPAMVHTHLAETQAEITWFDSGRSALDTVHQSILGNTFGPVQIGVSATRQLQDMIDHHWTIAHGVFLSAEDIEILVQKQAGLVHCPRSNLNISGQTVPDWNALQAAGIAVGLGTDSRFSCPDLDLRAEGRIAQQQHELSAKAVFDLMTAGSAKAIHQDHRIGFLKPGYKADMVLWWNPSSTCDDPYALWLSPQTEVILVTIDGRIVLERDPY